MICTTLEQSKKLVELGIDPSTADMFVSPNGGSATFPILSSEGSSYNELAWSLTALLDLMPKGEEYSWTLSCGRWNENIEYKNTWTINYGTWIKKYDGGDYNTHVENAETAIEAAFEMIVWLKEHKII